MDTPSLIKFKALFRLSAVTVFLTFVFGSTISKAGGDFIQASLGTHLSEIKFQIYLPPQFDKEKKWPVILFLHGANERGTDGIAQTRVGLGPILRESPERFPAIVVFPQATKEMWWTSERGLGVAMEVLQAVLKSYPVDLDRIYITGVSMGGWGAWELAELYPDFFAAVVPIAAAKKPDLNTARLTDLPVFAFHGDDDLICEVEATRSMVDTIASLGNKNVRYMEISGAGHRQTWEIAYKAPSLTEWLFQQKRKDRSKGT